MSKELVERLKKEFDYKILDKSGGGNVNMTIFNETLFADHCFARLFRRIREENHTLKSFQYFIYFDRSSKFFDYNSLHKELNKIFGEYFKIVRYFSGKKTVRILSFDSKKKFSHWKLWWMALYLASCMLRLTDSVFTNDWKKYFSSSGRKKPINNWKDLIYLFHRYVYSSNRGYELNDILAKKGLYARGKSGGEDELKDLSAEYLITLYTIYGKDFPITKGMISYLASYDVHYQYQTPTYNALKHIKESAK